LLVLILFGLYQLSHSRMGRLIFAIRDNEERARFLGHATLLPRALTFALSAAIGAVGGVLFLLYNAYVSPDLLHWTSSGFALVMAIVGGAEFVVGPAIGALAFLFVKDAMGSITDHWQAIMGTVLIVITVWQPRGLAGIAFSLLERIKPGAGASK
jgi:branched-chain amino acid transport system permease protein